MRLKDYDYSSDGAYFITICTIDRKNILSEICVGTGVPDCPQINLSPYGKIADKYINQLNAFYDNISVDKYVIMPDHIHLILRINDTQINRTVGDACPYGVKANIKPNNKNSEIAKFVGTFKRFFNKECGENIWQPRYYDHIIRNQDDYNEKCEYIENNPTKWMVAHED